MTVEVGGVLPAPLQQSDERGDDFYVDTYVDFTLIYPDQVSCKEAILLYIEPMTVMDKQINEAKRRGSSVLLATTYKRYACFFRIMARAMARAVTLGPTQTIQDACGEDMIQEALATLPNNKFVNNLRNARWRGECLNDIRKFATEQGLVHEDELYNLVANDIVLEFNEIADNLMKQYNEVIGAAKTEWKELQNLQSPRGSRPGSPTKLDSLDKIFNRAPENRATPDRPGPAQEKSNEIKQNYVKEILGDGFIDGFIVKPSSSDNDQQTPGSPPDFFGNIPVSMEKVDEAPQQCNLQPNDEPGTKCAQVKINFGLKDNGQPAFSVVKEVPEPTTPDAPNTPDATTEPAAPNTPDATTDTKAPNTPDATTEPAAPDTPDATTEQTGRGHPGYLTCPATALLLAGCSLVMSLV